MNKKIVIILIFASIFLFLGCTSNNPTSLADCEKLTGNAANIDNCYLQLAISLKDYNVCQNVKVLETNYDCYYKVSALKGDASIICKNIPAGSGDMDSCYLTLAAKEKDVSLCDKVGGFDKYFPITKSSCISFYSINANDISTCENIDSATDFDNCYSFFAEQKGDYSMCDKIKTSEDKGNCFGMVAKKLNQTNTSICDKIQNDDVAKASCQEFVSSLNMP